MQVLKFYILCDKIWSTSLIIREMQIKTAMSYHLIPARMAVIKKNLQINAGECVEEREHLYRDGRNVNLYSHYGNQYGGSLKK